MKIKEEYQKEILEITQSKLNMYEFVVNWIKQAIEFNLMVNENEKDYTLEYLVIQKPYIKDKEEMKCFERILIKILSEKGYYLRECNKEEWEAFIYEDKRRISKRNKNDNR